MTRKRKQNTAVLPEVERGSVDNPYSSLDEMRREEAADMEQDLDPITPSILGELGVDKSVSEERADGWSSILYPGIEHSAGYEKYEDDIIPFDDAYPDSTTKTWFERMYHWCYKTKRGWMITSSALLLSVALVVCCQAIFLGAAFLYEHYTTPIIPGDVIVPNTYKLPEQFTIEGSDKASSCSFVQADGGIPLSIFRGNEDSTTGKPVLYTIYCK